MKCTLGLIVTMLISCCFTPLSANDSQGRRKPADTKLAATNNGEKLENEVDDDDLPEDDMAKSVTEVPRDKILPISRRIDELTENTLRAAQQIRNKPLNDEDFLRRIYLDIAGRIPTLQEIDAFLGSRKTDKRSQLIDELLDSRAYVSHAFHFWADLLRAKSRLPGQNPGQPYVDYVEQSLAANKPYDEFVTELLTGSGSILARGNGAVGYFLRDFGMPEDNMANTVRVFLGTRIECAQCHDHPFDKWTQREFFEMVAFTGGMRMRVKPANGLDGPHLRRDLMNAGASVRETQIASRLLRTLTYGIEGHGTGLARLPDTFQESDGEPNEIVVAKTMFEHHPLVDAQAPPITAKRKKGPKKKQQEGYLIPGAVDVDSRAAFAAWLTSPDNPRFALVIANRLWKQTMGLGLIEPVDDLRDDTQASNPALMDYLAQQMVALDFDIKQYLRVLFNTQTYQSEATPSDVTEPHEYRFPGPLVRRMTPEQLWDSYLTLAIPNLDERLGRHRRLDMFSLGADDQQDAFDRIQAMTIDDLVQVVKHRAELESNPAKLREYNRIQVSKGLADENAAIAEQTKATNEALQRLRELWQQARAQRKPAMARTLQTKIRDLQRELKFAPGRFPAELVRASELPSPAQPDHFLRNFGQSDREQIDGASADPTINQALALMNGTIDQKIIRNPRTLLMQNMASQDSPSAQVDAVFRTILTRRPTRAERNLWLNEGKKYGQEAVTDLIWTLANSSEFIFVH